MPPKKKTEPDDAEVNRAEAAAAEVLDDGPLVVPFRGVNFDIDREVLSSARFLVAIGSGQAHRIIYEALGPTNVDTFLATLQRGEQMMVVSAEFLSAMNKAAGWGNSSTS